MKVPTKLVELFVKAQRVTALTGAGVSAESGVPTFRDAQTGLWSDFKPEELATPAGFLRNPRLVWEWYDWRRKLVKDARPNAAHFALVQMEKCIPHFTLITQNVDDLHQDAGSQNVIELHGNITRTKCFNENTIVQNWPETSDVPPRCPNCGGLLRPDVVWFDEPMPAEEMARAFSAASNCDIFLSIGTSTIVYPAAELPFRALESGVTVVEINTESTPLTGKADYVLTGAAGAILPQLLSALPSRG